MAIEIEKGQAIPPRKHGGGKGHSAKYPFRSMGVGDSFSVPLTGKINPDNGADLARLRLSSALHPIAKETGFRFTVRTLRDEGVVRCWRVA